MALRLATLSSPDPPLNASPHEARDERARALELQVEGSAALRGARFSRFRELLDEAQGIDDVHRRYYAQSRLICQGIAAIPETPARRLPPMLAAIADGALALLEREPREPLLLNWAGVAMYELWALNGAEALFEAALRLDPQHHHAARNLAGVRRRRKRLSSNGGRAGMHPAAASLDARSLAVAARAVPASELTLSLCMIVRDEEEMLPRCLAAAAGAVDEIVVVDTGSRDATIEIARSFGARVIEHPWSGSFAEARNVSFDAASGDWLMYLDADEVLASESAGLLRSLSARIWREAFYLSETSYTGHRDGGMAVTHDAMRVFRNRPEYRFEGRLHEQIAHRLPAYLPERLERTAVQVEHFGYLGDVLASREKSKRNIELLRAQQADGAGGPFLEYNLGMEMLNAGEPAAAVEHFERGWELLDAEARGSGYAFAPALAARRVNALWRAERAEEAVAVAGEALERFPGFTDLVLEQARAYSSLGERQRAIEHCERCIDMGDAPRRYTATVGSGTYLPRILMGELLLACGEPEPAARALGECVRLYPSFLGAVLPYAQALLASGRSPAAVVDEIEQAMGTLPAPARFLLGTALYEGGAAEAGAEQFEAVLARQPHSARAHVALSEALLAQRRYGDAASAAGRVPDDDQLAVAARRSELFARVLAGDERGEETLGKARRAGMSAGELELFAMWMELAHGRQSSGRLPMDAVGRLLVMLEGLLRLRELEAFELLLPALSRTPLSERDRRHALAEMYLRRGFDSSAAREWLAICSAQPEAPALLGLAQVASRQGMLEQAREFAHQALAREPSSQPARQLLATLDAGSPGPEAQTGGPEAQTDGPDAQTDATGGRGGTTNGHARRQDARASGHRARAASLKS